MATRRGPKKKAAPREDFARLMGRGTPIGRWLVEYDRRMVNSRLAAWLRINFNPRYRRYQRVPLECGKGGNITKPHTREMFPPIALSIKILIFDRSRHQRGLRRGPLQRTATLNWIGSHSDDPGSFIFTCQAVGLDRAIRWFGLSVTARAA